MIQKWPAAAGEWTAEDLASRFGPMPLRRIRFAPLPGSATEKDLLEISARENRLYELVDGVLVEKEMGVPESLLAVALIQLLGQWVKPRRLGKLFGPDATLRFLPGLVRLPDVAFVPWSRIPNRRVGTEAIQDLIPELVVEVLSPGNTRTEMDNKLRLYFRAGVRLAWLIDPRTRVAEVFTAPDQSVVLTAEQSLDGGDVLPGFTLPLRDLFAELDEEGPPSSPLPPMPEGESS